MPKPEGPSGVSQADALALGLCEKEGWDNAWCGAACEDTFLEHFLDVIDRADSEAGVNWELSCGVGNAGECDHPTVESITVDVVHVVTFTGLARFVVEWNALPSGGETWNAERFSPPRPATIVPCVLACLRLLHVGPYLSGAAVGAPRCCRW